MLPLASILLNYSQDSQSVSSLLCGSYFSVVWTVYRLYFWMFFVLRVTSKHMHTQLEFVSSNFRFVVVTELNGPL